MQGCALAVLVVDCHQGTEMTEDIIVHGWFWNFGLNVVNRFVCVLQIKAGG